MAPASLLSKLMDYYRSRTAKDVPVIAPSVAAGLSVLYTLIYVIPFYLSKTTRPSPQLSRDAPTVIKARIRAVTLSCLVTSAATVYVARRYGKLYAHDTLHVLGWWPLSALDIGRALLLVATLFLGPLFETAIVEGNWRPWIRGAALRETFASAVGWRNYIAGPITEEVVFRSALVPLHLLAKTPAAQLVFVTPLYFGIAHIHHFYEFTLTHPRTPLAPALLRSLFQFAYTSVFGWFAAFLFLRTGSLPAAVVAHSFCNRMGLPRLWGRVEAPARQEDAQGAGAALGVGWTVAYYVLLLAGAGLFYRNLWALTQSSHALVSFGGK